MHPTEQGEGSSRFLFVDETAKRSSGRQGGSNRRLINAHVQKDQRRKQRQSQKLLFTTPDHGDTDATFPVSAPTAIRIRETVERRRSSATESPDRKRDVEDSPSGDGTEYSFNVADRVEPNGLPASRRPSQGSQPRQPSPNFFAATQLDPFAQLPSTSLTTKAEYMLNHYVKLIIPLCFPLRIHSNWASRYIVELAFSEPIVLESLLAVASIQQLPPEHRDSVPRSTYATPIDHIRHKVNAIQMINRSMQDLGQAMQPPTLFAIWNISLLETFADNSHEKRMHLQGLDRLLSMRGGFQGLPDFLVELLLSAFISNAALTGGFPAHTPPPRVQPFSMKAKAQAIQNFPWMRDIFTGFSEFPLKAYLGAEMHKIIHAIREYTLVNEYHNLLQRELQLDDHLGVIMKGLDIEYRLLVFYRSRKAPRNPVENAIRLCLILLKDDLYEIHDPASIYHRRFAYQVKEMLEKSDIFQRQWRSNHEALVWVLSLCWLHSGGDEPWFTEKFETSCRFLEIRSWEQLKGTLSRFGYVARIYEAPMRRLWHQFEEDLETARVDEVEETEEESAST